MDLSVGGKKKLLSLVDALPQGPEFQCTPLKVVGDIIDERGNKREEILDVWHRDSCRSHSRPSGENQLQRQHEVGARAMVPRQRENQLRV